MPAFSTIEKRSYLRATIDHSRGRDPSASGALTRLQSLPRSERHAAIERLSEAELDRLIAEHIRRTTVRLTAACAEATPVTLQAV